MWYIRFYLGYCSDEWYISLFNVPESDYKVTGEISPGYAMLSKEDIQHVYSLAPRAKIIFIIRNPIERAWSHIRYAWGRGRFEDIEDIHAIKSFIDSQKQESYSRYSQTLDRWGSVYDSSQIHVAFFDDIREAPKYLLEGVASFLNIRARPMMVSMRSKVNTSDKIKMPPAIRDYLQKKYRPEIEKLDNIFDRPLSYWLEHKSKKN